MMYTLRVAGDVALVCCGLLFILVCTILLVIYRGGK
jgi:hypothetical protein